MGSLDLIIWYYKKINDQNEIIQLLTYDVNKPIFEEEEAKYFIEISKEEYTTLFNERFPRVEDGNARRAQRLLNQIIE